MLAEHHKAVETNTLDALRSVSNSLVVLKAIAARLTNIAFSHSIHERETATYLS